MKVTVDLQGADLHEICLITGITEKSAAVRKLVTDALQLHRRADISDKFLSGEWSAELENFEASDFSDRTKSTTLFELWRD